MDNRFIQLLEKVERAPSESLLKEASEMVENDAVCDPNLVKYFVYILLKNKSVFSFQILSNLKQKPTGVLPGITIAATEILASAIAPVDLQDWAARAWAAWLPPNLTAQDIQGTISAWEKIASIKNNSIRPGFIPLLISLMQVIPRDGIFELLLIQNPSVDQLSPFSSYVCKYLRDHKFITEISKYEIHEEIVGSSWSWSMDEEAEPTSAEADERFLSMESIIEAAYPHYQVVQGLGSDGWISGGLAPSRNPSLDIRIERETCIDVACLFYIARHGVETKRQFFKVLYPVVCMRLSKNIAQRSLGKAIVKKLSGDLRESEFLQSNAESIIDSAITAIRRKAAEASSFGVVRLLVNTCELSIGAKVDILRTVLSRFKPRDFPIWALKIVSVITSSFQSPRNGVVEFDAEAIVTLNAAEMITNEVIGRIKYVVGSDVGPSAQISLQRSILAVVICLKAVVIFRPFPQIQIVKLCEILDMMKLFTNSCRTSEETQIRLLVMLQFVPVICRECDSSVSDFFVQRFESDVWPLFTTLEANSVDERLVEAIRRSIAISTERPGFMSTGIRAKLEEKYFPHNIAPKIDFRS